MGKSLELNEKHYLLGRIFALKNGEKHQPLMVAKRGIPKVRHPEPWHQHSGTAALFKFRLSIKLQLFSISTCGLISLRKRIGTP